MALQRIAAARRNGTIPRLVGAVAGILLIAAAATTTPQSAELQTLRNQGKALFEELEFAAAADVFQRAAAMGGVGERDYMNLAAAQYRSGDDDAAAATLDRYSGSLEEFPGAPFLRGLIARRAADFDAARQALERAREFDATDPAIRYHLGSVYAQLGMQEEALAELAVVEEMGFDIAAQHYVSAVYESMQILLRQGRRDEAEPLVAAYREADSRLTEAARAPGALDVSRWTAITVPSTTVAPATPDTFDGVRFLDAVSLSGPLAEGAAVAVADLNGDHRPDWVAAGPDGAVWLSDGDAHRRQSLTLPAGPLAAGDYDRDGRPDLYVAAADGDRLFRNVPDDAEEGGAAFVAVEATGLPAGGSPSSVLWVDFDHDGDLDVLVTQGAPDSPTRLLRNLGGGAFEDAAALAGLADSGPYAGALFADFDADFDVDLFLWGDGGTALYTNLRDGHFDEISIAAGARLAGATAAVGEDLDNDGRIDLAVATPGGVELLRNLPGGTFRAAPAALPAAIEAAALSAADVNNDGYLDLVAATDTGVRLFANAGELRFVAREAPVGLPVGAVEDMAVVDLDADGAVDVVVAQDGELRASRQPAPVAAWLAVALNGIKNNVRGIGARVEVKAGGSYQIRTLHAAPLHFGVGSAEAVEVVRIRWPNGIVQNLLDAAPGVVHEITELERLEGSCPFLYTWDGHGFRFANEVLGSSPLGMLLADGVYHQPDGDEYAFVAGEHLRPHDGHYELRLTEELRETSYIDAARLLVVDHPESWNVLPDEGFGGVARPDLRLHLYEELLPVRARDQDGRDWGAALAALDGDWAAPFEPGAYDGLADEHTLTLELPHLGVDRAPIGASAAAAGGSIELGGAAGSGHVKLYLTGWVYWSMGSVNLAVDQDPAVEFLPVSLEVPDGDGGWRVAIEDIGLPIAKNTTLVVDVSDVLDRSDPRLRLRTTMRLYWDAIGYTVGGSYSAGVEPAGEWQQAHRVPRPGGMTMVGADGVEAPLHVEVLEPVDAELRARGFSAMTRTPEGYETFDYEDVRATAPWEQHRGYFTRFGAVGELLQAADDRYVVMATGDEIALRFRAPDRPLPEGWRRDYLVYLNGWLKDTDLNSRYGDRVGPLPFQAMSAYPYPASEAYPDDDLFRDFLRQYLTRPPRPINLPLNVGR